MSMRPKGRGSARHVLILSNTRERLGGADRDWVTLANALGAERIRVSWGGVRGSRQALHGTLTPQVTSRIFDLEIPLFRYLLRQQQYEGRSWWLWTKILADHLCRLVGPLRRLVQTLRQDPPDLVVSNTSVVTVGWLYARLEGVPHFWFVKEYLDPGLPAARRFASFMLRVSRAVVVPSRAVAPVFAGRAAVLPDGTDIRGVRRSAESRSREMVLRELELPEDRLVVAQVGNVTEWKGHHLTAEAFAHLAAEGEGVWPPFSLLYLGHDAPHAREPLERILAGVPEAYRRAVRFVEFAPADFSYLAAADVVVHPSIFPDPYPNAVREALALGKPVVGSRTGGIPELVRDGETGLLVEPGDAAALARALWILGSNRELRRRMGEAAREDANARFDVEVVKDSFAELLGLEGSP